MGRKTVRRGPRELDGTGSRTTASRRKTQAAYAQIGFNGELSDRELALAHRPALRDDGRAHEVRRAGPDGHPLDRQQRLLHRPRDHRSRPLRRTRAITTSCRRSTSTSSWCRNVKGSLLLQQDDRPRAVRSAACLRRHPEPRRPDAHRHPGVRRPWRIRSSSRSSPTTSTSRSSGTSEHRATSRPARS